MESSGEGPSTWKGCARRVPSGQGEEKPQEWRKVGQKLLHKFGIRMLRARVRVCVETRGSGTGTGLLYRCMGIGSLFALRGTEKMSNLSACAVPMPGTGDVSHAAAGARRQWWAVNALCAVSALEDRTSSSLVLSSSRKGPESHGSDVSQMALQSPLYGILLNPVSSAKGAIPALCIEPLEGGVGGCHPSLGPHFFGLKNPADQTKVDTHPTRVAQSGFSPWESGMGVW